MSRHRHMSSPYDYDYSASDRARRPPSRPVSHFQDDSPMNSDDESYLQHIKKEEPRFTKPSGSKEKPTVQHEEPSASSNSTDRLNRLENMVEELLKRGSAPATAYPREQPPNDKGEIPMLEPRRHTFTTSMWINKIDEVAVVNNWGEKSTLQFMEDNMSGILKAWYNSLPQCNYTWPEWKILIAKTFPDNTDFITTLKRLVTRIKQPDETIRNYYFSKMYLIDACKITGEDAVSCLIDGLNNQRIQERAKDLDFLTPGMMYSQFLVSLPEYEVDYVPSDVPPKEHGVKPRASSRSCSKLRHHPNGKEPSREDRMVEMSYGEEDPDNDNIYTEDQNPGYSRHQVEPENREEVTKRAGPVHSRLDKNFMMHRYTKTIPNNKFGKYCSVCNMYGHLTKFCRNAFQVRRCGNLSEGFIKACFVNNQKTVGLVDTGCDTITIRQEECEQMGLTVTPLEDPEFLHGFTGASVQILGETEAMLEVDSVKECVKLTVVPSFAQKVPMIIGEAFFNRPGIGMLYEGKSLKIFRGDDALIDC